MLILSRKEGEGIVLGDDIIVKVVGISKGVVKLGLEAPQNTLILRSELAEAVKESNIEATSQKISPEMLDALRKKLGK